MNRLIRLLDELTQHPNRTLKKITGALRSLLFSHPDGRTIESIGDDVRIEFGPEWPPVVERMYFGRYELTTRNVMQNYLSRGDVFVDVGANIGYLSAVGLNQVGKLGEVHSFEPVDQYYKKLERVQELNPEYTLEVNRVALGERETTRTIRVSASDNLGWNTLVPNFMERFDQESMIQRQEIDVIRFSDYCSRSNLNSVDLVKIDVEGFELPVLKGFEQWLESVPPSQRPVVLCEVAPQAYDTLEYSLNDFEQLVKRLNYRIVQPENESIEIDINDLLTTRNILLKPDGTG